MLYGFRLDHRAQGTLPILKVLLPVLVTGYPFPIAFFADVKLTKVEVNQAARCRRCVFPSGEEALTAGVVVFHNQKFAVGGSPVSRASRLGWNSHELATG